MKYTGGGRRAKTRSHIQAARILEAREQFKLGGGGYWVTGRQAVAIGHVQDQIVVRKI